MRVSITIVGTDPFDVADFKPLPATGPGTESLRICVAATGDPGASAFNLWAALIDDSRVYCVRDIACTKVASARGSAAGAGDYICDVDVAGSGKDILDVLGAGMAVPSSAGKLRWVIGCPDAGMPNTATTTAINVTALPSGKI